MSSAAIPLLRRCIARLGLLSQALACTRISNRMTRKPTIERTIAVKLRFPGVAAHVKLVRRGGRLPSPSVVLRFVLHLSRDLSQGGLGTSDFCEYVGGAGDPDERLWIVVVMGDVGCDGLLEVGDAGEAFALDAVFGDVAKEPFDHVQPRCAGGREVHD